MQDAWGWCVRVMCPWGRNMSSFFYARQLILFKLSGPFIFRTTPKVNHQSDGVPACVCQRVQALFIRIVAFQGCLSVAGWRMFV
jgi:hypothetical protein